MSSKRKGNGWWDNLPRPEAKKDHQYLPDSLGIGYLEERDADGQLRIYFTEDMVYRVYRVTLGKYAKPLADGSIFYVADRHNWAMPPTVEKFDDLLLAIAHIVTLKEKFDEKFQNRIAR